MVTNRRMVESSGPDCYVTPPWATRALLHNEKFSRSVWEPACGPGIMADTIRGVLGEASVVAMDKYEYEYEKQEGVLDFLTATSGLCENIITNPPYNIANDFVLHAIDLMQKDARIKKSAFLLRTAFLEGGKRYQSIYKETPPTRVWIFSERVTMYPYKSDVKGSGGTQSFAWFVWDNAYMETKSTELLWIPPGTRKKFE